MFTNSSIWVANRKIARSAAFQNNCSLFDLNFQCKCVLVYFFLTLWRTKSWLDNCTIYSIRMVGRGECSVPPLSKNFNLPINVNTSIINSLYFRFTNLIQNLLYLNAKLDDLLHFLVILRYIHAFPMGSLQHFHIGCIIKILLV